MVLKSGNRPLNLISKPRITCCPTLPSPFLTDWKLISYVITIKFLTLSWSIFYNVISLSHTIGPFCDSIMLFKMTNFLPQKVKTQCVHFRSHAEYFLLPQKISEKISRRLLLFETKGSIYYIKHMYIQPFLPWEWIDLKVGI